MDDTMGSFNATTSGAYGVIQENSAEGGSIKLTYEGAPQGTMVSILPQGQSSWQPIPSGGEFPVAAGSTTMIRAMQGNTEATGCDVPRTVGDGTEADYDFSWDGVVPPLPKVTIEAKEMDIGED